MNVCDAISGSTRTATYFPSRDATVETTDEVVYSETNGAIHAATSAATGAALHRIIDQWQEEQ